MGPVQFLWFFKIRGFFSWLFFVVVFMAVFCCCIFGSKAVFMVSGCFLWFQIFFMVFQGSRLFFYDSRSAFMVFKVPDCFFMVPGGFLWFFKVPG